MTLTLHHWSAERSSPQVGVVVKLFACRARDPGFDSWSRCYDFRDWLSPASGRDMAEISLKRCKYSKHLQSNRDHLHIDVYLCTKFEVYGGEGFSSCRLHKLWGIGIPTNLCKAIQPVFFAKGVKGWFTVQFFSICSDTVHSGTWKLQTYIAWMPSSSFKFIGSWVSCHVGLGIAAPKTYCDILQYQKRYCNMLQYL